MLFPLRFYAALDGLADPGGCGTQARDGVTHVIFPAYCFAILQSLALKSEAEFAESRLR